MIKHRLLVALMFSAMLPAAAFAQDEHRIQGKSVAPEQVAAVQEQCDAMRQGEETSPVAEVAAEAPTQSDDAAQAMADDLWIDGGTLLDLEKLSIESCDEGKFALTKK